MRLEAGAQVATPQRGGLKPLQATPKSSYDFNLTCLTEYSTYIPTCIYIPFLDPREQLQQQGCWRLL